MFELVKNVITNKETTCKPKRTRPKISFCSIQNDVEILIQPNSNSTAIQLVPLIGLTSRLDIMRIPWVVCGWSSSHIFCQKRVRNSSGRQKSACKLLNNLLILISCFIASEVPSLGMGRHHILSFEELFPQISSFDMIFESTPHWMSQFWKQLIPFFRKKLCLTPCPHVLPYP